MPFHAIAPLCLLFIAPAARADFFDVADLKCSELVDSYLEQFVVIDAWLSGYYHGKSNSTLVNLKQIAENTAKVFNFARQIPIRP